MNYFKSIAVVRQLHQWDPLNAISELYKDKTRRVTAITRRPTSNRVQRESDEECDESDGFSLDTLKT